MKKVLTVCIGNICRSPLAEVLLKRALPEMEVWSAGLSAMVGWPADAKSIAIAHREGLDLSQHKAQQITEAMVQAADIILVMETEHKQHIVKQHPEASGKVFTLGIVGSERYEIDDPYQKPLAAFEKAYEDIERGVNAWAIKIEKLAKARA